jgi:putative addiction module component (TIGR02574 family)
MALTLEQIVEGTRAWSPDKIDELMCRLTGDLHVSDTRTQSAWKAEIGRRIDEIQSGKVKGVPGDDVSARIGKIVGS